MHTGGVGGWDDNVRCSCTHGWCYVLNFSCCTCTHGWCYVLNFSCCTCTQGGWGGGMITFVAVAHMVDATSLTLVVALAHMVDATSLTLVVALAHMVDATSWTLVVALAHRGVGGWDDNVRCSCTHGWCYVFNFSCCTLTLLALTLSNFLQSCRFFERLQGWRMKKVKVCFLQSKNHLKCQSVECSIIQIQILITTEIFHRNLTPLNSWFVYILSWMNDHISPCWWHVTFSMHLKNAL